MFMSSSLIYVIEIVQVQFCIPSNDYFPCSCLVHSEPNHICQTLCSGCDASKRIHPFGHHPIGVHMSGESDAVHVGRKACSISVKHGASVAIGLHTKRVRLLEVVGDEMEIFESFRLALASLTSGVVSANRRSGQIVDDAAIVHRETQVAVGELVAHAEASTRLCACACAC